MLKIISIFIWFVLFCFVLLVWFCLFVFNTEFPPAPLNTIEMELIGNLLEFRAVELGKVQDVKHSHLPIYNASQETAINKQIKLKCENPWFVLWYDVCQSCYHPLSPSPGVSRLLSWSSVSHCWYIRSIAVLVESNLTVPSYNIHLWVDPVPPA